MKDRLVRDLAKVKTRLNTTLHRAFLQSRRKQNRFPQEDCTEVTDQLPAISPVLSDQVDALQVLPALPRVNDVYQAAVALFHLKDDAYKDIAVILDAPIGTVTSRNARGVAQLREIPSSDDSRASTPLNRDTQNGALVPVPSRNSSAPCESHLCHGRV